MVNYWDASAIVSILANEPGASRYRSFREETIVTWWGTSVECVSAIARREREGAGAEIIAQSYRRLTEMESDWLIIQASERLRRAAVRALKTHPLRAGDALHLAAALLSSSFEPANLRFLTEDKRLKAIARKEGFEVD